MQEEQTKQKILGKSIKQVKISNPYQQQLTTFSCGPRHHRRSYTNLATALPPMPSATSHPTNPGKERREGNECKLRRENPNITKKCLWRVFLFIE
jgi:hypothetical protein